MPTRKPIKRKFDPGCKKGIHTYDLSFKELDRKSRRRFYRQLKREEIHEYEKLLKAMVQKLRVLKTQNNSKNTIRKMLDKVIPLEVFGNKKNRKKFYEVVNRILVQSRNDESIPTARLYKGYDMAAIKWLEGKKDPKARLRVMNKKILRFIVKPLILYYYYPFKHYKNNRLEFVERKLWYKFIKHTHNNLIQSGHITLPSYIVAKKHFRGKLVLFPKSGWENFNEYRPILFYSKDEPHRKYLKSMSKKIFKLAKEYSNIGPCTYQKWKKYTSTAQTRIFGIKIDLKDAFGNVNLETVYKIIVEKKSFNQNEKKFFHNYINNQCVYFHKKVYKWNHGILQGDPLSPSINQLYLCYMEKHFLLKDIKLNDQNLLCRHVDDYFFCSTNISDIENFEKAVRKIYIINETKTQKVINNQSNEITFYGQNFNLANHEVTRSFSFDKNVPIRYAFKRKELTSFLAVKYNKHNLKIFELNTVFNSERTVLLSFFKAMLYIAVKFDYVMKANVNQPKKPMGVRRLNKIIFSYNSYVLRQIEKFKGKEMYSGKITLNLLKRISYRAFYLIFRKSNFYVYININEWLKKKCNSWLNVKRFGLEPRDFTKLPKDFSDVNLSWKAKI